MRATAYYALTWMETETREIAQGLRRRDPDLLARLIEQYQYRLLRYLLYLVNDRAAAEDLFQETWMRVLERGSQYNGRHSFVAWLMGIARHMAIDWMRQRRPASLDELMRADDDGPAVQFASTDDTSPLTSALANEQAAHLANALAHIPVVYREVLVLRFQEEMKLEEIAEVAGVPLSTVKSRLYRGVTELRSRMAEASIA